MNFKTDECKLRIKWELSAAGGINDWNNQLKKQWLGSLQLLPQEGVKTSRKGGSKILPKYFPAHLDGNAAKLNRGMMVPFITS